MTTDPYGKLHYGVGSEDDFICFDFADNHDGTITLHSVVNSETGCFIEDFDPPRAYPKKDAPRAAEAMLDQALDWCAENNIDPDPDGWNNGAKRFLRAVKAISK